MVLGGSTVSAETVAGPRPPLLLARFGVGYDSVDIEACTAAGVAVTITPDGARRPVAAAAVALLLAVRHNLVAKDRLVREGRWADKVHLHGTGLSGSTVGMVGLGNVGSEVVRLLEPFDVRVLVADPQRTPAEAADLGVALADVDEVVSSCDALVLTAALTPATHHVLDARRLASMRPGSVVVNIARGPLVDTDALVDALEHGPLRAAGLDVFEEEPLPVDHPLVGRPDVVLAPHALAWTSEMALGNGRSALSAVLDALAGRRPEFLVDPAVVEHPRWRSLLQGAA